MTSPQEYASANRERFLNDLLDWLRIPSVSADRTNHRGDVRRAADWLADDLRKAGLENVELITLDDHHPIVYADWLHAGASAPTVLIYGHYDVQPPDPLNKWETPPFEPTIRDGKIYARGAADDKGQAFAQVKAVESLLATGGAPVNIKLLIEGEEEVSSAGLSKYVASHADKLAADVCVISDSGILAIDQPSIDYSLRGIVYYEVELTGAKSDLHSGAYGGAVHNPQQAMVELLAQLHLPDGRVNIPGFYDDVLPLSQAERDKLKATNPSEDAFRETTGVTQSWGEPEYTISERTGARPTLEIHGIGGGFSGEGAKTVLPGKALAKLSCRLVANQDPHKIYALVEAHLRTLIPPTVTFEMRPVGGVGYPVLVDIDDPALKAAEAAYAQVWGKDPVYVRGGGSIPVVAEFQQHLKLPVILLGFGLETDNLHAPNEHFYIELFYKGTQLAITFLQEVANKVTKR